MSEANDNVESSKPVWAAPKLERLLRQWGAKEAADRAPIGRAPHESDVRTAPAPKPSRLPWAIMVAVAATAIVALGIFTSKFNAERTEAQKQGKQARMFEAGMEDLQHQLDSARKAASRSAQDVERQIALLAKDANEAKGSVAFLKSQIASAQEETKQKAAELTRATDALAQWPKRLEDETARTAKVLAEANIVGQRLASASAELERDRKTNLDALAAAKAVQAELEAIKARNLSLWSEFEQAYMAAAAPGETGLRAAQTAVRRSQLIDRIGKVRATAEAPQRALLEKLEVTLTRLELVDASNFASEDLFRSLLRTSGVLKQVEEASSATSLAAPVRSIYFEARLILMGAERAG